MSAVRVPVELMDFVPYEIAVAMANAAFHDPIFDLSLGKRGAWREREPSDPPGVDLRKQIWPGSRSRDASAYAADQAALSAWRDVEAARRLVADRAAFPAVGEQARPDARTLAILGRAMAALDVAMAEVDT